MKKLVDDQRLIFKCCSLYYEDGLGQKDICDLLGISRPTVSRMLSMGKKQGVVRIEVRNPDEMPFGQLERQMEKVFGLQEVIIVPSVSLQEGSGIISSSIGSATLKFLCRVLTPKDYVGISMGMTIQNVTRADFFIEESIPCTFVPLLGGISESRLEIHSNLLVQEMATRFGGKFVQFFAPALFSSKEILSTFLKEKTIQDITNLYRKLDLVLMGIGEADNEHSTVLQSGYITDEIMNRFIENGAVGDISLRYFDIDGNTDKFSDFNERVAGIPLAQLTKVQRRVGVVAGRQKVKATLGAVRGKFINVLITDADCARGMLEIVGEAITE